MSKNEMTTFVEMLVNAANNKGTNWNKADPDIVYSGSKITLPNDPAQMPIPEAIKALQRKEADENTMLDTHEIIDAYYTDGMVAFMDAMKEIYGWASPVPTPGFFGPTPPQMLTIKTGPGPKDTVQVPWGSFVLPGVEKPIQVHTHNNEEGEPLLAITGKVRKREQRVLKELAERTREILKENSIYKGRAIRLKTNADGNLNLGTPPEFLPTSHIRSEELVLNELERAQVDTALWTVIRNTEACLQHKIPIKRGVLLEGPYGTGKTLVSTITSQVCVDNKWTFISLDDVRALQPALLFAKRYAPAVIFAEDVDRIADKRDQKGNDLLNTIDGILSKDAQVVTVLTTNHVEKLEKAMLRPGRLDAVISMRAPDAGSVQKLIRIYARGLVQEDADLSAVGEALDGQIPATVREVVERSKLGMIARGASEISPADLLIGAESMKRHFELLAEKPPQRSPEENLGHALKSVLNPLANGRGESFDKAMDQVREIHETVV